MRLLTPLVALIAIGTPIAAGAQPAMFGQAVADTNNAAFSSWTEMQPATSYTAAQLQAAGYRSIEIVLTTAGTVTLTDQAGHALVLPYAVAGPYQLPFVPARIDFSDSAAGRIWGLK